MENGFPKQTEYCPFCEKTHIVEKFSYTETNNVRQIGFYCEKTDQYFSVADSTMAFRKKQRTNN